MVAKVLRVKAKAPRMRLPVSLGERAWIDPIVIGHSGPGDHCQITLERWLPIDDEPGDRRKPEMATPQRAACRHAVRELAHGATGQADARREWMCHR